MIGDRRRTECPLEREAIRSVNPSLIVVPHASGETEFIFYRTSSLPEDEKRLLKKTGVEAVLRYKLKKGYLPLKVRVDYDPKSKTTKSYALGLRSVDQSSNLKT